MSSDVDVRPVYRARAVLGDHTRRFGPSDPRTVAARRALRRAQAERTLREIVAGEPALTGDDLAELATILVPATGAQVPA